MKKVRMSTLGRLVKQNENTQEFISFSAGSKKWYRVAISKSRGESSIGFINITSVYNLTHPFSVSLIVSSKYQSAGFIKVLEKSTGLHVTKARIVYPVIQNRDTFIELYYDLSVENTVSVVLSGRNNIELLSDVTEGDVPNNYESYEITL